MIYSLRSRSAFTLLEILVVTGILAILATVAFATYTAYLSTSRDGSRLQDMTKIYGSLQELKAKNSILPSPDQSVTLTGTGGQKIGYQGYAGTGILSSISLSRWGKDPYLGEYYTYVRDVRWQKWQIFGYFEESGYQSRFSLIPGVSAESSDRTTLHPVAVGDRLGVFVSSGSLAPIQSVMTGTISLTSLILSGALVSGGCTGSGVEYIPLTSTGVGGVQGCFESTSLPKIQYISP